MARERTGMAPKLAFRRLVSSQNVGDSYHTTKIQHGNMYTLRDIYQMSPQWAASLGNNRGAG
eukprot:scaffold337913_cov18-Prasinocladus_malaysianus.AAC.1